MFCDSAHWITTPRLGTGLLAPASPMLRRRFDLDKPVVKATLMITALGLYEAYLNGERVGHEQLQPGWTDYHKRLQVQSYDVTSLLTTGGNMLGSFLGDGWYSGKVAHMDRELCYGDRPMLKAMLTVEHDDGSTSRVVSDEQWQWTDGPILSSDLLDGERYDARQEVWGWCVAGGEDVAFWRQVEVGQPPVKPAMVVSEAPPVRVTETLMPISDPWRGQAGWHGRVWLFDLGQNFAGKVRLKIRGPRGMTVRLRFAEVLTPDQKQLDCSNLRSVVATDTYTLQGDPKGESWTPRFTFHGFRYVELRFHAQWLQRAKAQGLDIEPISRDTITGLVLHNDMTRIGQFETGHDLVNKLQNNIVWGQRSNFLEVPTDCPQRDERLGWTGDAQVFASTASFNYDTTGFFKKWGHDLTDSQGQGGEIPYVSPNVLDDHDAAAGWSDAVVVVPWSAYRASGDRSLLERQYETIRRWAEFQARTARDGVRGDPDFGIFAGFGDWLALDNDSNDPSNNATPKPLIGTAYHAYSQGLFARIAKLLGHEADAKAASEARDRAILAFNQHYIANGKVKVRSQTSHLMALAFDVLDASLRPGVFEDLLDLLNEREGHLCTGFLGTPLWCEVLTRFGRIDKAFDLLLVESYPGWLYPVTLGATTMWERWNSWHPEQGFVELGMNSLNHYAYGAVGDWMYRRIAGIDLDMSEDVGPKLVMRPNADRRLGSCRASLDSVVGRIESVWAIEGDKVTYTMKIPEGIAASVVLPGEKEQAIPAGEHVFTQAL